jgi:hypothetical protein
MAQSAVFSPRAIFWLITVGCLSFVGAAYFSIYGDAGTAGTTGASAYSYSAIGHRAFVETLQRMDVPVVVSRNNSKAKAGRSALLIVAEPHRRIATDETVTDLLAAQTVLFVLPKWDGRSDEAKPRWLEIAVPLPRDDVQAILQLAIPDGRVRRAKMPMSWKLGSLGVTPTLTAPQLIETSRLKPIVATDQGILIGELVRGEQRIWILSDPDILSNHGLGRGDNSVLALALVDALRPRGGTVIIDETIHGFRQESNLWRAMFQYPFVIAILQAAAAIIALIWAATGRFGAPIPAEKPLKAGKVTLLNNTASLLQFGGHGPEILRRYLDATFRDVVRRLRAPRNIDEDSLVAWVDRVGKARGVRASFWDLRREIEVVLGAASPNSPNLLRAAKSLYRWKQEIIHGP